MKRRILAGVAALVVGFALAPGVAWAAIPGSLDQSTDVGVFGYQTTEPTTQTFTAGRSGLLTHVELHCATGGAGAEVSVAVGSSTALAGTCPGAGTWVDFVFPSPPAVSENGTYTITITPASTVVLHLATFDYAGGAPGASLPFDLSFRTYVYSVTNEYVVNPAVIPPGVSSPAMLTGTAVFDALPFTSFDSGPTYTLRVISKPSWFSFNSLYCGPQIRPQDCDYAEIQTNVILIGDGSAMTVTFQMGGTMAAAGAVLGSTNLFTGQVCVTASGEGVTIDFCTQASVALVVGQATPPPTATAEGTQTQPGSLAIWLLGGLMAAVGSLFVVARRAAVKA